ncbi:NAD(P)H-dependent glycerol-3-phosphate dehydrogenase [Thermodesulfobacteriota bacterium]
MAEEKIDNIGVIGAGAWGTTLANLLAEKGLQVDLWVREEDVFLQIKNEGVNRTFLPDMPLSAELNPVKTYEEAVADKDLVMMVTPSHVFRKVLTELQPLLHPQTALMAATKGIENDSLMVMSQVAESILPGEYREHFAYLAGPSFAKEVSLKYPTAVTIACRDLNHAERLQQLFYREFFRVYTSQDLIGTQLCGAIKNVIAIAAGISDGLGFGHNARAALITRGLAEMTRLGVAMGSNPLTFAGLAGMGDLVLTCTGDLSRNRNVGLKIGEGMLLSEILEGMNMVAEGIKTARSAYGLANKKQVDMPIIEQMHQILYEDKDPKDAVRELMTRELKVEIEH